MIFAPNLHLQWTVILALSVASVCWWYVRPRFGIAPAALLAYSAASALYVWAFRDNRYITVPPYDQMALRYFACDSLAKMGIVCAPLMLLSDFRKSMDIYGRFLWSGFVAMNTAAIIYQGMRGCLGLECGGLVGNPSISMGVTICALPLFVFSWRIQWPFILMAALATWISGSSVAIGLFVLYACLHFMPKRVSFRGLAAPAAAAAGLLGVVRLAVGAELLNDSDRFALWSVMLKAWASAEHFLVGMGLGTYHVMSINIQSAVGFRANNWWNTMHNEPLQFLFECGAVGFLLFATCYGLALLRTYRRQEWGTVISVLLYGAYMLLDPALHFPVPAFFGAWLFVYALRHENTNEEYL